MPILEARSLSKLFPVRQGLLQRTTSHVQAVLDVDLELERGECFALVGESGSGKTTLGRSLLRLIEPTSGTVVFNGEDLADLSSEALRRKRRHFQMIFQDSSGALNPRMTVGRLLSEPLEVHSIVPRSGRTARVEQLLELVGLPKDARQRYPHEFSGGQRQRIGIARALASEPDLIVADEPVSALDVSVRAQIVNLLARLQQKLDLTVVFIAHDLAVVEQISDRVGVMYLGRIVESAPAAALFATPLHPYTVSLLSAVPLPDPDVARQRVVLPGEPPDPVSPLTGCAFHPRCPIAREKCSVELPRPNLESSGTWVACHYPGEA